MKNNKLKLTPKQSDVFKFIKRFQANNGYPPTRQEIAKNFKFKSVNAATDHVKAIERAGWIKRTPNINRGMKIL